MEDVSDDDFGEYCCQTEDGRASLDYKLIKGDHKPLLLKQIDDVYACDGDEVTFDTEVADENVIIDFNYVISVPNCNIQMLSLP